jgi:tetraacyldisaccharide 4'-kinase
MFSNPFLKSFRFFLLPFALLYWLAIAIRNWMFDKKIIRSSSFALPLICVGNLSVGGTGKSPMVEYLVRLLKSDYRIATLSRGYKRKTKGYALANEGSTALEIGDEPMQFHIKFPDVPVAVGEQRLEAIPQLLHDRPETEVIILDDAFQHRRVRSGFNILLTEEANLYTQDFYLPTGQLRDQKKSANRAQVIIVTKCDIELSVNKRDDILRQLAPQPHQSVFFTAIEYGEMYHINSRQAHGMSGNMEALLVTGIANPSPLKKLLEKRSRSYEMLQYPDHHIFTIDDLKAIRKKFRQLNSNEKIIITTEKDSVRLVKFKSELADLPLYILPIRHHFLFNESARFNELVSNFIKKSRKTN